MVATVKHGGKSVMVWGTMARSGVGSLHFVEGSLNSEAYIKILRKYVKKDARELVGRRFIFQQDCAPCHSSKATSAFLRRQNIAVLPWSSQSPDMNPIEHLWDEMERRLNKEIRPRSLEELKARLVDIWRSIEPVVI